MGEQQSKHPSLRGRETEKVETLHQPEGVGVGVGRHLTNAETCSSQLRSAALSTGDVGQSGQPLSSWGTWTCPWSPLNLIY